MAFNEMKYEDGLTMLAEQIVEMVKEDAEDDEATELLSESYTADTIMALQDLVKEGLKA